MRFLAALLVGILSGAATYFLGVNISPYVGSPLLLPGYLSFFGNEHQALGGLAIVVLCLPEVHHMKWSGVTMGVFRFP